jgi:putative transposase
LPQRPTARAVSFNGDCATRFTDFVVSGDGQKGVCMRLFAELGENPDLEYLIIDSTIVRAHQHAAGTKRGEVKMRRSGVRAAA